MIVKMKINLIIERKMSIYSLFSIFVPNLIWTLDRIRRTKSRKMPLQKNETMDVLVVKPTSAILLSLPTSNKNIMEK